MKPPKFRYHAPSSLDEALDLLAAYGDEAVVLSGGQSLIPMLNLRLARPAEVIDITRIDGLGFVESGECWVSVGALVTHRRMEIDPEVARLLPMAREAAGLIGFRAIRNRGTVGGSVAHADPSAEWPAVLLALDGSVEMRSSSGVRQVGAGDFFRSVFTTAAGPTRLSLPSGLAPDSPTAGDFRSSNAAPATSRLWWRQSPARTAPTSPVRQGWRWPGWPTDRCDAQKPKPHWLTPATLERPRRRPATRSTRSATPTDRPGTESNWCTPRCFAPPPKP